MSLVVVIGPLKMADKSTSQIWSDEQILEMDTSTSTNILELKREPIREYIGRKRRYGKNAEYIKKTRAILREFETFLFKDFGSHLCDIDDTHVAAFNEHLRTGGQYYTITGAQSKKPKQIDLIDRTRHEYLRELVGFYNWLVEDEGVLTQNPAKKALNDLPESEFDLSPPGRPRIEMPEMRAFVQWLSTPIHRAIILFLLKTGARIGEMVNLDLCCLNLSHPIYQSLLERRGISLDSAIRSSPDTVFLQGGYQSNTEIRGEARTVGNKRQRPSGTLVPIDDELKTALLEYLLTRRCAYSHPQQARPVFLNRQGSGDNDRLTRQSVYGILTKNGASEGVLKQYGWWSRGLPTEEKVTPHYFRHYFTHNHRHNQGVHDQYMPEGVIAYIRGDAPEGDSVREQTYRHDDWNVWERYIKRPYLEGIYEFNLYD
ncbi:tyrosine-type recombinase/integrase [Halorubrum sp. DM2]|uniref:tyrosine-type recombinase/integrase n=1 Tax=Halorubrum sp. DM2 TaxID=2527867 RepID=UPI0024B77059|nr:tyrosine-type recombinase/integrase [Halorubrum sp. DM2]